MEILKLLRAFIWFFFFYSCFAFAAMLVFLYVAFSGVKTISWEEEKGVIIEKSENTNILSSGTVATSHKFQYSYATNGNEYISDRFGASMFRAQSKFYSQVSIGEEIVVFVNPNNPKESILFKGVEWQIWVACAVAFGMGVFGIVAVQVLRKKEESIRGS